MHRQLGLELADSLVSCDQLAMLSGRQTWVEALVDAILAAPRVDRLFADAEIGRHFRDPSAGLDQLENPTPELPRISPSPHAVLLRTAASQSKNPTPRKPGQTIHRCLSSKAPNARCRAYLCD